MAGVRGRYKVRGEKRKSRFYLVLSLLFLVVMLVWGFPLLLDFAARGGGQRISGGGDDVIPPQKPIFSALVEATNSAQISVAGYTEAGAEVSLWLNEVNQETIKADESGGFDFKVALKIGENELYARARDQAGNESLSDTKIVVFDNEPLTIILERPADGATFYGISEQNMEIMGSVNKQDARIYINGSYVSYDKEGKFSQRLKLTEGENKIVISGRDKAGYESQIEMSVNYVR